MEKILTFRQAIESCRDLKKPHIFLGNGFSRACRNDIFAYDALFDRADFGALSPHAKATFEVLGTKDFEVVIKALLDAATVLSVYNVDDELCNVLMSDAIKLREVLVNAIAGSHPELLSDISQDSYRACKVFLNYFERTFSLNYDLLLYWAVMQKEIKPEIKSDDGFRTPEDGQQEYVTWEIDNNYNQSIYYLHGALHLFDAGYELQKYTWVNTGKRLIHQIRSALEEEKYPLFVAEGTSEEKLKKIKHNAYLTKALDSFSRVTGTLFIFGHSLARNDEHFFKLIEKGKLTRVYVSIFGDQSTDENKSIIARAKRMQQTRDVRNAVRRKGGDPIEIFFYDASSAKVWG